MSAPHMAVPKQPWATSQYAQPSPPAYDSQAPMYNMAPMGAQHDSDEYLYGQPEPKRSVAAGSKFHPKNWSKRTWIIIPIVVVIILIIIIVGAVVGSRANRYPSYSYLRYTQSGSYSGETFFDDFSYFNAADPALGTPIIYDSREDAVAQNVTGVSASGRSYLQLNTTVIVESNTSQVYAHSARVESNTKYNDGLFLFDVYHSPYGCAVWPAVWLSSPQATWPEGGEIDIIEAVNKGNTGVQTTLHTTDGCKMNVKRKMTGTSLQTDCHNTTNSNAGCGVQGPSSTFGAELNQNGGGVWALEWRSEGIRSWFFPRASVPADVQAGLDGTSANPDPTQWGEPLADFPSTDCDIGSHFKDMNLIANIDTCGQFAGQQNVFTEGGCGTGTCADYVQANRDSFGEAYWEFGAWKVFSASASSKRWASIERLMRF